MGGGGAAPENDRWLAAGAARVAFSGLSSLTLCDDSPMLQTLQRCSTKNRSRVQATSATSSRPCSFVEKEEQDQRDAEQIQATSVGEKGPPQSFQTEMTPSEVRLEDLARKARTYAGALKIFSGNGNIDLAQEVSRELGIELGKARVGKYADGEVSVVIDENVRGKDVYVLQPTCRPVNDNLMELLLMVSTLRRASARRITVVIPYYGYARQDRKMAVRISVVADSRVGTTTP